MDVVDPIIRTLERVIDRREQLSGMGTTNPSVSLLMSGDRLFRVPEANERLLQVRNKVIRGRRQPRTERLAALVPSLQPGSEESPPSPEMTATASVSRSIIALPFLLRSVPHDPQARIP
jgi:hypothetical protein